MPPRDHLNEGVLVHKHTPGCCTDLVPLKLGGDGTEGQVMMGLRST